MGITEVLAPTSQRAKQEKLFNLIRFNESIGDMLVKARLSVLVWGSLDILCMKPITSGRVQLSKSRSLLSIKVVVMSFRLTYLKASMFIGVSSYTVEVIKSPLMGPLGVLGM